LCLDVPPPAHEDEVAFWKQLTGWELTPSSVPGFARLHSPQQQPLRWFIQKLDIDAESVTAHLDLCSDNRDAEVARHARLGGTVHVRQDWWTVLSDPTGRRYCVTRRAP